MSSVADLKLYIVANPACVIRNYIWVDVHKVPLYHCATLAKAAGIFGEWAEFTHAQPEQIKTVTLAMLQVDVKLPVDLETACWDQRKGSTKPV